MNYSYYLAPAWYDDEGFRTVGLSSILNKSVAIQGCRYLWPAGTPIQVEQPNTPVTWTRLTVAKIPDGHAAADGIYAHICCMDDADPVRVTPKQIILVADDVTSPAEWERMVVAVIDPAFWATYGDSYVAPGNGVYYGADYRATVCVPEGREVLVPPTWTQISKVDAIARHPTAEL